MPLFGFVQGITYFI